MSENDLDLQTSVYSRHRQKRRPTGRLGLPGRSSAVWFVSRPVSQQIDLSTHTSKTLSDVPDPWNFEYVMTVYGSAAEACSTSPAKTTMRHSPFVNPSGGSLDRWRELRGQFGVQSTAFVQALMEGRPVPASYEVSLRVDL